MPTDKNLGQKLEAMVRHAINKVFVVSGTLQLINWNGLGAAGKISFLLRDQKVRQAVFLPKIEHYFQTYQICDEAAKVAKFK